MVCRRTTGRSGRGGVAQAGHELYVLSAEPGVCGLAVDEQLEASGTVRVALPADLGIRDVEATRILRCAEFARDVEGLHGDDLAGARLRDSHVAAVFAPADQRLCVGQPVFDAVELRLQLLFGLLMSSLLLAVGTVQRPDLFVQGSVLRVEAVDLLLLPFDTGGADHRPDPLDDIRPDFRRGVFQPGTLQFALHALQRCLGAVQFGALLCLERGDLFVFGAHLPLLLFEQLDGLPLLLFETKQRVDVLLQILLLGDGLTVELLRGDVARLRTVNAALQSVFGHRRGIGVLILLEPDARHDVVGAEAEPCRGFRAIVPLARGFWRGGTGLAALARDDGHDGGVDMRGRFVAVHDGRDDILRPEGLAQPGEVVGTSLR